MKRNEHDAFREMELYLSQKRELPEPEGFGGLEAYAFILAIAALVIIFVGWY